jgi:hypothetical protein
LWLVRELSRLLVRIAVAVVIAGVVAGVKALASGGGLLHMWRITLLALGGLMFLLAGTGRGGAHRRLNLAMDHGPNYVMRIPGMQPKPDDPTLTASAVFVGSGLALLALGLLA